MQQPMLHQVLAGAVAGLFAVSASMPAAAAGPRREASQAQAQPALTTIRHKTLVSTSFQGDSARVALNAGFNDIGAPITVKCTHACTVVVQTMVQVEETDPYWAICPTIDSVDAIQGCNWQGIASSSGGAYVTGNGTYFWSLEPGTHTLQAQVYLSVSGASDNWGMTVAQYK
jgi:hypothetical protein